MTLPRGDFIGRFLLHVLPKGFQKVRAFGWLAPRRKRARMAGNWSDGTANVTLMGRVAVMTASPVLSAARTMLPASTSRRPMRPPMGAVMRA